MSKHLTHIDTFCAIRDGDWCGHDHDTIDQALDCVKDRGDGWSVWRRSCAHQKAGRPYRREDGKMMNVRDGVIG